MAARRRGRDGRRELADIDQVFAGLSHASRRQILLVLLHHGGRMTAGEIAKRFECSWPTTTRHLLKLECAGLVVVARQGRERVYRRDDGRLRDVVTGWIDHFARGRAKRGGRT